MPYKYKYLLPELDTDARGEAGAEELRKLDTIIKEMAEAAANRTLIPFIGPGVSRQGKHQFPAWSDITSNMLDLAINKKYITSQTEQRKMRGLLGTQPRHVADVLRYRLPTNVYLDFLVKTYNPSGAKPTEVHTKLFELKPTLPLILTTNYDILLEKAFIEKYDRNPTVCTYRSADTVQKLSLLNFSEFDNLPVIFKVHGSITEPSDITLTDIDYRKVMYQQAGFISLFSTLFITHNILLLGFKSSDAELTILLRSLSEALKYASSPDYILLPADTQEAEVKYFESIGIEVIRYEAPNGNNATLELLEILAAQMGGGDDQPKNSR